LKIALVGDSGTGKTALAKMLVGILGIEHKSAGDFFREIARERGMTLLALEAESAKNPQVDFEIDMKTTTFGKEKDDFVFDGRLAAECIRDAVKVLLVCDDGERFRRISLSRGMTLEAAMYETLTRERLYRDRFKRYYNIDDYKNPRDYCFDIKIDTSHTPTEEVARKVVELLQTLGKTPVPA
jgi:CMP/dCMP kinase